MIFLLWVPSSYKHRLLRYGHSHDKGKAVVNGDPYTDKTTYFYLDAPLD